FVPVCRSAPTCLRLRVRRRQSQSFSSPEDFPCGEHASASRLSSGGKFTPTPIFPLVQNDLEKVSESASLPSSNLEINKLRIKWWHISCIRSRACNISFQQSYSAINNLRNNSSTTLYWKYIVFQTPERW